VPPEAENNSIIEEACLLAQAGAGDREAFRQLYSRYSVPLFSLAVRLVGDPSDAEELLQDAFVKIWRSAGSYDPAKSRPFTWVVTILRRTCIDHLRKRRHFVQTVPFPDDGEAPEPSSDERTARTAAQSGEDAVRVLGALEGIPQNQRSALELALFSELTQTEIASRLEQPVGTVKSWIRRGLLELRTTLTHTAS
jgi:RNA polymerase sigma-70 factor (ECF subfamily)